MSVNGATVTSVIVIGFEVVLFAKGVAYCASKAHTVFFQISTTMFAVLGCLALVTFFCSLKVCYDQSAHNPSTYFLNVSDQSERVITKIVRPFFKIFSSHVRSIYHFTSSVYALVLG